MYLNGLADIFDQAAAESGDPALIEQAAGSPVGGFDIPVPSTPDVVASSQSPTNNADWTKLISTAITTWGNFAVAKTQADTAVKTAPYRVYAPYGYTASGAPVASPLGISAPISGTMIVLGAAAIAAFLLLKG